MSLGLLTEKIWRGQWVSWEGDKEQWWMWGKD